MTFDVNAALAWVDAGCSIVPIATDGSKAPAINWKESQATAAAAEQVRAWSERYDGFGVVGGAVSGGLEMLEFEGRAVAEGCIQSLRDLLNDNGFGGLWERLSTGYMQASPSGGIHLVYRVEGEAGEKNTKLARRPSTADELAAWRAGQQADIDLEADEDVKVKRQQALDRITQGHQVPQVLIETRGEGGQFVAAPSSGRTHPSGGAWRIVAGSPASIPTITEDEHGALFLSASTLDTMPTPAVPMPATSTGPRATSSSEDDDKKPGEDFNDQATWKEILEPHGWTVVKPCGNGYTWRRPGKKVGISATTGQAKDGVDRLFVFTTSTSFESWVSITKFAAYAHLNHANNFSAAARELRHRGFGGQGRRASPLTGLIPPGSKGATPPQAPVVDGNLALVHSIDSKRSVDPQAQAAGEASDGNDETGLTGTDERHRGQLRIAERFVIRHHDALRKAHGIGWHCWDGARWRPDEDEAPLRAVIETIKVAYGDLWALDKEPRKALLQDINRVESANGMAGVLTIAGALPPITTASPYLDADPYLFNLPTGTVDLRTGDVREHDRADLITRVAGSGIGQDPSPEWETFLARILPDEDVRRFVQRLFGYALLGRVTEHVMPIFTGTGANGKGTLRDAVLTAFGDYALEVDPRLLMESKHERHSTELMELRGRRLVFCSETEKGRRFAEATMKRLVGGDPIQARRMHKDPITFLPSHTLIMLTNHLPTVSGDDPAVWRRLLVVPFDVVIPPDERDPTLSDKLRSAAPAVLCWVHEGWLAYQSDGLSPPDAVMARTEAYRTDSDALGRFIDERCLVNPHMHVRARELYQAYVTWCSGSGERHVSETEFAKSVAVRGFQKIRSRGGQSYQGLGLLTDDDDETGQS